MLAGVVVLLCTTPVSEPTPDMQLRPEVPLVTLLRLVHLRVPLPSPVPGGRRGFDDARVHDGSLTEPQLEKALASLVLFHQMAKVEDGSLVGDRFQQPQACEPGHRFGLVL